MTLRAARPPIFYGWYILAAGFFALFVSVGARNGFGVFVVPMESDLSWTRSEISFAIAIGVLVNGLSQPFLGRIYDRYGARVVISLSLLTLGLSTMLLALTGDFGTDFAIGFNVGSLINIRLTASLLFLIAIYGFIMSTASSGVSLVTVHAVLAKWFYRRRGIALSVSTAAMSAGGLILTPFAAVLISWQDWRAAWLVLGALVLVLALPLMAFFMRDKPEDMGETPDGDRAAPAAGSPTAGARTRDRQRTAPLESENWRDSFKTSPIWQLSGAYLVCGVTTLIISTHYVPFAIEMGISPTTAAFAFGFMQGLNVVGVLVVGVPCGQVQPKESAGDNLLHPILRIRHACGARRSQLSRRRVRARLERSAVHRHMVFRRARGDVLDSHAAAHFVAHRRHIRRPQSWDARRVHHVRASDRRLDERAAGGNPAGFDRRVLHPVRLGGLDAARRDAGELVCQRAQILRSLPADFARACGGVRRGRRLTANAMPPLLSVPLHHGEPGDPVLLGWINDQIHAVLGLGDLGIALVFGAAIVAIPVGIVAFFAFQRFRGA